MLKQLLLFVSIISVSYGSSDIPSQSDGQSHLFQRIQIPLENHHGVHANHDGISGTLSLPQATLRQPSASQQEPGIQVLSKTHYGIPMSFDGKPCSFIALQRMFPVSQATHPVDYSEMTSQSLPRQPSASQQQSEIQTFPVTHYGIPMNFDGRPCSFIPPQRMFLVSPATSPVDCSKMTSQSLPQQPSASQQQAEVQVTSAMHSETFTSHGQSPAFLQHQHHRLPQGPMVINCGVPMNLDGRPCPYLPPKLKLPQQPKIMFSDDNQSAFPSLSDTAQPDEKK